MVQPARRFVLHPCQVPAMPSSDPPDASTADQIAAKLSAAGQQHVLRHWDALDAKQRAQLADQLTNVDLELIARLYADRDAATDFTALAAKAEPPPAFRLHDASPMISKSDAARRGSTALDAGKVGVILVAGGQGSRLGFEHPKGMFPIGPVSGHTLFQILLEKILATSRRCGAAIPLYIMTSAATHAETADYLARNDDFGLPAGDVKLFQQGNLPAVDAATGKLLLESPATRALSPDGHGGMLAALVRTGALADMGRRGLEQLYYFQVDNPLVIVCDPVFLGYHLLSGSEMSTQVVSKTAPLDRVGNVVSIDGAVQIIEYSDLPHEAAHATNEDASLKLWAGNTAVHIFERAFLERVADQPESLPFHVARKAVAAIDEAGKPIAASGEKNAIKFERFIFDLLPSAKRAIVMEVDPQVEFAPVKNADGEAKDTPTTVRQQMIDLHRHWLEAAGTHVAPGVAVEIRPTLALNAEELCERLGSAARVDRPTFFEPRAGEF
jgi:UDP-N-acetylglucosamine/UDP-N-acetylgalactosamine diphosphorylase